MRIVDFSIRRPVTVTMLMAAILVFGLISFGKLPINLLPDISYPSLTIRTEYPGTSPQEVESLISKPIEDAVGVVPGAVRVTSVSRAGVSDVTIEFAWNTNMDFAALDVREKLDLVKLPEDAEKPVLLRFDPSLDPIMRIGLTGDESLVALRLIAEDEIKPRLESLAAESEEGGGGVAAVKVSGGLEEEIHVEVSQAKLASLDIPISQVAQRLAEENVNLTGGNLKDGEAEYLVRTLNEFRRVDEIDDIVIAIKEGRQIRLKDIGSVRKAYKERDVITRINGKESVELAIYKEADANTVAVAKLVRERLKAIERELKRVSSSLNLEIISDQSRFIEQAIDEVLKAAIYGGLLAMGVLYLFLLDWKSTFIVSFAIPLSVVATFFLMYISGISLNIMSLGGLALGIGMLVDNSIVVLESIDRFKGMGLSTREASARGASEVGMAVSASTLTTICVFFPIVFVQGIAGQLFRDQALTVTYSLSVSLLVALTLIPMLSSLSLGEEVSEGAHSRSKRRSLAHDIALILLFLGCLGLSFLKFSLIHEAVAEVMSKGWRDGMGAAVARLKPILLVWLGFAAAGALLCGVSGSVLAVAKRSAVHIKERWFSVAVFFLLVVGACIALFYISSNLDEIKSHLPRYVSGPAVRFSRRMGTPPRLSLLQIVVNFAHRSLDFGARGAVPIAALLCLSFVAYLGLFEALVAVVCSVLMAFVRAFHLAALPVLVSFRFLFGLVVRTYPYVIRFSLTHKAVVILLALGLFYVSWLLLEQLGSDLIPEMSQGELIVNIEAPVGTPLERTADIAARMERIIQESPLVRTVYTMVGSTGQTGGKASEELQHIGQINIRLKDGATREDEEKLMSVLRPRFDLIPSLDYKFSRPAYFSFVTPIEVEISGYNLRLLKKIANEVMEAMREVPGLADIRATTEGGNPEIQIIFDRDKVALRNLDVGTIAPIIRDDIDGDVPTEFKVRDRKIDIRVRAKRDEVNSIADIERLFVNPKGARIPLESLAHIRVEEGPSEIRRVQNERVAIVSANLRGMNLSRAVKQIEEKIRDIPLPADFKIEVVGQSREMAIAFRSMRFAMLLAVFLVYLVMASQFESLLHPFVIMFSIPFAIIGVAMALALCGYAISVVVLIGVVMLAGIVVNDAIVLVDCINIRRREGLPRREAIVEAGKLRLRPIVMTTATTVLGLLPMALMKQEGAELRGPMAVAVIGGMISSTLLTLVLVPTIYDIIEGTKERVFRVFQRGGNEGI